ncbi:hypothetical protein J6590_038003 [Homalodisca vitripennis]|nr:hypothetical protein J6590_038003 [Homalodisca vitripennis]
MSPLHCCPLPLPPARLAGSAAITHLTLAAMPFNSDLPHTQPEILLTTAARLTFQVQSAPVCGDVIVNINITATTGNITRSPGHNMPADLIKMTVANSQGCRTVGRSYLSRRQPAELWSPGSSGSGGNVTWTVQSVVMSSERSPRVRISFRKPLVCLE